MNDDDYRRFAPAFARKFRNGIDVREPYWNGTGYESKVVAHFGPGQYMDYVNYCMNSAPVKLEVAHSSPNCPELEEDPEEYGYEPWECAGYDDEYEEHE